MEKDNSTKGYHVEDSQTDYSYLIRDGFPKKKNEAPILKVLTSGRSIK